MHGVHNLDHFSFPPQEKVCLCLGYSAHMSVRGLLSWTDFSVMQALAALPL